MTKDELIKIYNEEKTESKELLNESFEDFLIKYNKSADLTINILFGGFVVLVVTVLVFISLAGPSR